MPSLREVSKYRVVSGPYFPVFGLNSEITGKYGQETTPYLDTFHAVHIIEKGSLKSFISGKGYKRTKRAHQLLALAMEILHFQSFLESKETFDTIGREIFNLEANDSCDLNLSKELLKIFKEYEEYQKKTENGIHGKTAQYWFGYIRMVQLYHQFIASIRTSDLELYIFCLKRLSYYFSTFNHPNYARWLVR